MFPGPGEYIYCSQKVHVDHISCVSFFFSFVIYFSSDCDAVWFGFEYKSYLNCEIKMHAIQFCSIGFLNVIQTKPNKINAVRIGSVVAVYSIIFQYQTILNIQQKELEIAK
jgi:hypothetical protein